jgi:putative ABC transport system permease protein
VIDPLRRSARRLARSPGFTVVAVLSLGAGLGLSTGALALVEGLSKQPDTQITDLDRLSAVGLVTSANGTQWNVPALEQMDALRTLPGVERVSAWQSINVMIEVNGDAVRNYIGRVPQDFFQFLGVKPAMGRVPSADEAASGTAVLVSAEFWRRKFAGKVALPDAIVLVNDRPYHVSGVLPAGLARVYGWPVMLPFPDQSILATETAAILLRRRAGITSAEIQPALDAAANRLVHAHSATAPRVKYRNFSTRAETIIANDFLFSLLLAGYGVLLVACVNVAALMLARGLVKRRDYALRLALGATRFSLAADVCSELIVLTVAGIVTGGAVAYWSLHALMSQIPEELVVDGFVPPEWNWHVARIAGASVIAAVAMAGAIPAWRAMQTQPVEPLKESAGTTTGRAETRFHLLLVAEFAISMVLVFSTSLMLRSTHKLTAYDFGYDANKLVLANVNLTTVRDSAVLRSGERIIGETVERVRAVNGVASAAEFSRNSVEDGQVAA